MKVLKILSKKAKIAISLSLIAVMAALVGCFILKSEMRIICLSCMIVVWVINYMTVIEENIKLENELFVKDYEIPKGATNGDMIKAMFPICCSNMGNFDNGIVVDFMGDLHSFDMEWWNAPYKQGNEKWIPENISYDNVQEKVATQREVICGLNAMNDELQAKLDKIKQIVNENEICN